MGTKFIEICQVSSHSSLLDIHVSSLFASTCLGLVSTKDTTKQTWGMSDRKITFCHPPRCLLGSRRVKQFQSVFALRVNAHIPERLLILTVVSFIYCMMDKRIVNQNEMVSLDFMSGYKNHSNRLPKAVFYRQWRICLS